LVKAIFFDWFNTLARYEPRRETLHSKALRELGIEVSPAEILPGVLEADSYFFEEHANSPVEKRKPEEQAEVYTHYQRIVLAKAGVKADQELLDKVMKRIGELFEGITFALFDDVLPNLRMLKQQGFTLGLLTNLAKDMGPICRELGLEPYLDFVITSAEAGVDKPNPLIFKVALQRAGVDASEVIHVGDQYRIDVVGARGVGISPILIDRFDLHLGFNECSRIRKLAELANYL